MEQVGLNVMADLYSDKIAMPVNAGVDSGNQLFKGLLEKSVLSGKSSQGTDRGMRSSEESAESDTGLGMLETGLRQTGLPMGQLRIPRSAIPELMSLLERQGFQKEEARSLIASLSDKDGSIRVDRLLARLQKNGKAKENQDLVIQAQDIPYIGEALAAMGLGQGKIKELIEGATNAKGELSLERLSANLSATLPGADMRPVMAALLERAQVQGANKADAKLMSDPDARALVNDLAAASDLDAQKRIREEIAKLLREKGMAPQEVKSITETLTASHAKVISKSAGMDPEGAKLAEADAKALMEKVVLSADRKAPSDEWREKILGILQKDKSLGKDALQKNPLQEDSLLKAASAEQVKSGEQKSKIVFTDGVRPGETKQKAEADPAVSAGTRKGNPVDLKSSDSREGVTADLSAIRFQKDNVEAIATVRAKEGAAALPEPLPKVLDRMLWMIQGGEQKGRLHITPPELGRLDIDIVIKQGHLQAQLNAENPQVKELIESNLGQLKQHLADVGLVIDRFDVMIGLDQNPYARDQAWTAGNRRGQSSRQEQNKEGSLLQSAPAAPAQKGYSLSQIDMLV